MKRLVLFVMLLPIVLSAGCWLWTGDDVASQEQTATVVEQQQQPVQQPTQAKIDRKFMLATVGELKVNESGWIPKECVVIDSEQNVWVDGSQPIVWSINELQPNKDEIKLLKVWRLPQGFAIGLPQIHLEYDKKYFLWQPTEPDQRHLKVVKVQLPIPGMPEQFMPKTIADLREGQGGWIETNAISVDLDRKIYVDIARKLVEIDKAIDDHRFRLLWCKRGPAGYEIYIPRVSYEKNSWWFQWEPSQHYFREPNNKRVVVIFTVAPEVSRAEKIDAPEREE